MGLSSLTWQGMAGQTISPNSQTNTRHGISIIVRPFKVSAHVAGVTLFPTIVGLWPHLSLTQAP